MVKYKDLLFMLENQELMIKGRYHFKSKQVSFKSLDEEDTYYSLEDIDHIQDNFMSLYVEDEDLIKRLILHIRADRKLVEKIESNKNNKLLFLYK